MESRQTFKREETPVAERVIKIEEWILLILLAAIPMVNFVVFSYFSFGRRFNQNKKNFARAVFIYLVIVYGLFLLNSISNGFSF